MLLQRYLRAGRYRLDVTAHDSAGRLGVAAAETPLSGERRCFPAEHPERRCRSGRVWRFRSASMPRDATISIFWATAAVPGEAGGRRRMACARRRRALFD